MAKTTHTSRLPYTSTSPLLDGMAAPTPLRFYPLTREDYDAILALRGIGDACHQAHIPIRSVLALVDQYHETIDDADATCTAASNMIDDWAKTFKNLVGQIQYLRLIGTSPPCPLPLPMRRSYAKRVLLRARDVEEKARPLCTRAIHHLASIKACEAKAVKLQGEIKDILKQLDDANSVFEDIQDRIKKKKTLTFPPQDLDWWDEVRAIVPWLRVAVRDSLNMTERRLEDIEGMKKTLVRVQTNCQETLHQVTVCKRAVRGWDVGPIDLSQPGI